jgi:hypothetical protein
MNIEKWLSVITRCPALDLWSLPKGRKKGQTLCISAHSRAHPHTFAAMQFSAFSTESAF